MTIVSLLSLADCLLQLQYVTELSTHFQDGRLSEDTLRGEGHACALHACVFAARPQPLASLQVDAPKMSHQQHIYQHQSWVPAATTTT